VYNVNDLYYFGLDSGAHHLLLMLCPIGWSTNRVGIALMRV
jgi:hypothetical protein